MAGEELFDGLPEASAPAPTWRGEVRVSRPHRDQLGWEMMDLDQLISADHPARLVASFVAGLDLSPFYDEIDARADTPGRDAIDPALLLSLWLYAAIEAEGSAREIARLARSDHAYRWLCGGVGVNHHALSDFRSTKAAMIDRLLTDSVTALVADGLVSLETLAHDSVKVRAAAGSGSFRRGDRLEVLRKQMEARVAALRGELESDPAAGSKRRRAATERAARDRLERIKRAQARLAELEKARQKRRKKDRTDPKTGQDKAVRVSTTDPEARIVAFSYGERRPGYSLQVTGDPTTLVAVGLSVHDSVDPGQVEPALDQVEARYAMRPTRFLADAGFCSKQDIAAAHARGVEAIIPSNNEGRLGDLAYATTRKNHLTGMAAWRERMVKPEIKALYRLRCQIECVFAHLRNRGLRFLHVRGKEKVRGEALIHLLAHNMVCGQRLQLARQAALAA
jgi:transposase